MLLVAFAGLTTGCGSPPKDPDVAEEIKQLELVRLRALVDGDTAVASRLHADDFQLITPNGAALRKDRYLGEIASARLDYRVWEPGDVVVRVSGDFAVLRYRDVRWEVLYAGALVNQGEGYHTNLYERRGEQWEIVWSHASGALVSP
jgi:hypothetical protein